MTFTEKVFLKQTLDRWSNPLSKRLLISFVFCFCLIFVDWRWKMGLKDGDVRQVEICDCY